MSITIVTAGIIMKDEKILITQRKEKVNQGLKWEFPGGKLEENETPESCLKREIAEELGIEIEVKDIFEVVYHKYDNFTILLLCYGARYIAGTPKTIECNDFNWIKPEEFYKFNFAEADKPIIEKIVKKGLPSI